MSEKLVKDKDHNKLKKDPGDDTHNDISELRADANSKVGSQLPVQENTEAGTPQKKNEESLSRHRGGGMNLLE